MSVAFQNGMEVIERLKAAKRIGDVLRHMRSAGEMFGYDFFIITNLPVDENPGTDGCAMLPSWPEEWRARYFGKDYLRIDPVAIQVKRTTLPFLWSDAPYRGDGKSAARVMGEATEFGLNAGLCVPIHHINGREGGVSFGARRLDLSEEARRVLHMVSLFAYETTDALLRAERGTAPRRNPKLSPREVECLRWTADGKTSWETSEIVQVSERTVDFHLKNAARKLDAVNRVQAVAEALRFGIIA